MPAPKRPCANDLQGSPASKRRGGAEEVSNDKDKAIPKLLKNCSQKQKAYIACMKQFFQSHECRLRRLQDHVHYHLIIDMKRRCVRNSTLEQIKEYEKELAGQNTKEAMLKLTVKEMSEQEDKLEKIVKDVANHKKYMLKSAKKLIRKESGLYGPYEEELADALQRVPGTKRDDAEMEALPKLKMNDFDNIEWPEMNDNWSRYSKHWNSELEEATVCRSLNEEIQSLNERLVEEISDFRVVQTKKGIIKIYDENRNCTIHADRIRNAERTELTVKLEQLIRKNFEKKASIERLKVEEESLDASKKQREDLLKSIQEEVNTDSLKCSVCFEALTNGEQSLRCPQQFGSCGHTVCATCMTQFKAPDSPYHWTCPQCRAPSDKVLTNWALMQLIKEIAGQPQRVVVETPQAIPIVPAPFRLEERNDPDLQEDIMFNLIQDIDDAIERHRLLFEDMNNRRVNRDQDAPALELPPPRERDPVQIDPIAPAPPVPHNPPPMAPAPVPPPPRAWAPVAQDPPAPALAIPDFGLVIPPLPALADLDFNLAFPPQPVPWAPVQVPQLFPAPWAPLPALAYPNFNPVFLHQQFPAPWAPPAVVLAPARQAAPQIPLVGHINRMAAEWEIDEEEEGLQNPRYRGVSPIPPENWVSEDEEEDEDEEQEDGPEDVEPELPAAPAPQAAPQNPRAGYIDRVVADRDIDEEEEDPEEPRYRAVSPMPEEDWDRDVEDDGEENEDDEHEDEREDMYPGVRASPQPYQAPQASPVDDDLEVIEVHFGAPPQVRAPAVRPEQIEEEIEYIVVD